MLSTFFFAALPAGPVFNGLKCWSSLQKNSVSDYREGCYRLFEGFVYLFAVAGFAGLAIGAIEYAEFGIISSGGLAIILLLTLVAKPVAGFAFLFATFYGYSRMAEGSALLLGFRGSAEL